MKKTLLKCAALAFALLLCSYGYAQKRTVTRDYTYRASDSDSKLTARKIAIQEMQTLLLMEIGQALQSEQVLKKLSVTKDGKETFSESFSQEVMAITAGFVEMKIIEEEWDGKFYYVAARMTVDTKEVSQRVADALNSKQKGKAQDNAPKVEKKVEKKEEVKAEEPKTELGRKIQELEAQKKEMELKKEQKRQQEAEAKKLARLEKELAKEKAKEQEKEEAKRIKGWYQPHAFGLGVGLGAGVEANVRYTRNISPNFGFDVFKLSGGIGFSGENLQLLTGLRFSTNRFGKSKRTCFYTSVGAGIGHFYDEYDDGSSKYLHYEGFAFAAELEAGFHIYKYFFLGLAVNQAFFKPDVYRREKTDGYRYTYTETKLGKGNFPIPFIGLRLGVDIGKSKPY